MLRIVENWLVVTVGVRFVSLLLSPRFLEDFLIHSSKVIIEPFVRLHYWIECVLHLWIPQNVLIYCNHAKVSDCEFIPRNVRSKMIFQLLFEEIKCRLVQFLDFLL